MSRLIDLTGQRFGKLLVVERAENTLQGQARWRCKCDCGNESIVRGADLRLGNTITCGCGAHERMTKMNYKHGATFRNKTSRLYNVWSGMKQRCNYEKHASYKYYGGRGIRVCKEWDDFEAFKEWAESHGYDNSPKRGECTLDRINVNGNYEPDNCRWVSMKEQAANKR